MTQGTENKMAEGHEGLDAQAPTESYDVEADQDLLRQAEAEELWARLFLPPCDGYRSVSIRVEVIKARIAAHRRLFEG
jgi:hypothetical protein